jgi:hypothetical protein
MPSARTTLVGLLIALALLAGVVRWIDPLSSPDSASSGLWILFLYGLPVVLASAVLASQRWAFMGSVIYATVGLALDIATFVFEVTHDVTVTSLWLTTGLSALLNFLVIIVGGRGFLMLTEAPRPPTTRRPSPPSELSA